MGNSTSTSSTPSPLPSPPSAALTLTPFDVTQVTLTPGSRLHTAAVVNARYLLSLSVDRLLFSFRSWAGVDTRGVQPYGGWEAPSSGSRGHFVGHALSAYSTLALSLQTTQPDLASACRAAATSMVSGLAEVQTAIAHLTSPDPPGYLNAQSPAIFDDLEALKPSVPVPYYVIHKIMAGLVAAYRCTSDPLALTVVSGMADYFAWRMGRLTAAHIETMINTRRYMGQTPQFFMEHGGMLDVLVDVYRLTHHPTHLTLLQHFDRPWFRTMLATGDDQLGENGEHCNTELPVVVGLANLYALTQASTYRAAVLNLLGWVQTGHQFVTGGVSGKSAYPAPLDYNSELFHTPQMLDRQINSTPGHQGQASGESCCAHNLQKANVYALAWTGDARWGDEFEKRFVNCVMPQQQPTSGQLLYNLNLKQASQKGYGTPDDSFWCCYGTGVEAYAGLANGHFYHDSGNGLWVSSYVPATVQWAAQGLSMEVSGEYPLEGAVRMAFTLAKPAQLVVRLRIPYWAVKPGSLQLNGQPLTGVTFTPGTFASIDRLWSNADVLTLTLPYSLYYEPIPDRVEYVAPKYGPLVLVACGPAGATYDGTAAQLMGSLKAAADPCTFTATLQGPLRAQTVTFKPIHLVTDEYYNGYTIVTRPPAITPLDAVTIADPASESAHSLQSLHSSTGTFSSLAWRDAMSNGYVSYTMQVSGTKQTYLRCMYDGDDVGGGGFWRLHDVQLLKADATWATVATQSLDREAPGGWYVVVYPLPMALTAGHSSVTIRFQAKGFNGLPGTMGGLFDQVQTYTLSDVDERDEPWTLVSA